MALSVPLFLSRSPWAEILTETNSSSLNLSPRVFCHIVTKVTSPLVIKVVLNHILPNTKAVALTVAPKASSELGGYSSQHSLILFLILSSGPHHRDKTRWFFSLSSSDASNPKPVPPFLGLQMSLQSGAHKGSGKAEEWLRIIPGAFTSKGPAEASSCSNWQIKMNPRALFPKNTRRVFF